ncbi:hypothetical protein NC651_008864 [Populus alba x Populus x berolinensis]|nr:hypothetical protein NC651_008864 [Populus alba x Populus x berolinensis]
MTYRRKVQKNCIFRCVHCYGNCILKPRTRITIHQLRQYFIHYVPPRSPTNLKGAICTLLKSC